MGDNRGESTGLLSSFRSTIDGGGYKSNYASTKTNQAREEFHPPPENVYSWEHIVHLYHEYGNKQNALVLLSVVMLIIATACERITFKIMVDRMLPYKFELVQIIYLLSSLAFVGLYRLQNYLTSADDGHDMQNFPQTQIIAMAVADTIPFLFMAFSASGVPPTMTVILMHSSTIFVVIGSKYLFPERNYTNHNFMGLGCIGLAIGLCFLKIMIWRMDLVSATSGAVALSCWMFLSAASMHGLATLYKEKNIIEWARPVDNFYLTYCLFFYQFLVTICVGFVFNLGRGMNDFILLFIQYNLCGL
jgi:hypothetical protein